METDLQRRTAESQLQLVQLGREVRQLKQSLAGVVAQKQALSEAWTHVLEARARVRLLREAYETNKRTVRKEFEQVQQLKSSNVRRDERLRRVRTKDLRKKNEEVEREYAEQRTEARQRASQLHSQRRVLVTQALHTVFPIEVESLSREDAGEEDYAESSLIDYESSMEVDGGWLLSGLHKVPAPHLQIVTASLPSNGDYSPYLTAARERKKAYAEAAQTGVEPPPQLDPSADPYLSTPAALVFTAQFVELIASTLDQPLPYPLPRHLAISEYGSPKMKRRDFLDAVAKLDDNIMYLCFSQNVPLSAVTPGHTLENLHALVTHSHFGRSGAFECHPELMRYSGGSTLSQDTDNEPPSVSYTTDQSLHGRHGDHSDTDEEEEEDSSRASSSQDIARDWESLEQSEAPPTEELTRSVVGERSMSTAEWEAQRGRLRRLDYDSTYLDYVALGTSERNASSVSVSATDTVRLMDSIDEVAESGKERDSDGGGGQGLLGKTLSSLWSSTFGRTS